MRKRPYDVLFLSELYWPEETSTGHVVSGLAERLARDWSVAVITAHPTYAMRSAPTRRFETRRSVDIHRVWSTRLSKDSTVGRLANYLSVSVGILWRAMGMASRSRYVITVSNPPILPFVGWAVSCVRRVDHVVMIHDAFPDLPIAAGLIRTDGLIARMGRTLVARLYRSSKIVVVLGEDMAERVGQTGGIMEDGRVVVVRNWADLDSVTPGEKFESELLERLALSEKFVVQLAGNLGPLQDIETVLEAMSSLRARTDIHMLIAGTGRLRSSIVERIEQGELTNVTLIDPLPRTQASEVHQACDVAIVSLIPGMYGVSVPSRSYNFMAAGRPIIAMVHPLSEVGRMVTKEEIGWLVPEGNSEALAAAIAAAADSPDDVRRMGNRARRAAEARYTIEHSVAALHAALEHLDE